MANLLKQNEIDAGGGYLTDRGTWQSGFKETVDGIEFTGYALNDIVHTTRGVWLSLVDDNTTDPDTDATGSWRRLLDKQEAMDFVRSNQPQIGADGYGYVYNPTTRQMEKTEHFAVGGLLMPGITRVDNDLVIDGGVGDPTGKFVQSGNDLVINF